MSGLRASNDERRKKSLYHVRVSVHGTTLSRRALRRSSPSVIRSLAGTSRAMMGGESAGKALSLSLSLDMSIGCSIDFR